MKIEIIEDYRQLSLAAADIVIKNVKQKRKTVLGLPTGSTPEGMYAELVSRYRNGEIDFSEVTTFNLDEYCGLPTDHPQSYHDYMRRNIFDHVNVREENRHIPLYCDNDDNAEEACSIYEQKINAAGGIDLQILGIGTNGHIGFNEPDDYLIDKTHLVDLSKETIEANSRFFASPAEVPRRAITMGMGSIMRASEILLLASGKNKARAVKMMCCGKISTAIPASFLQLHRNIMVLLDHEAAAYL